MRGFTIIEMLVIIAVTALVGVTINTLAVNFYRSNAYIFQETSAIDSAHQGLRAAFEGLREASYGDDGSYPIQSAATSSITFFSDVDGDGSVEKIRLYLANGTFYRGVTDSTSTPPTYAGQTEQVSIIAPYVRNDATTPIFRYFDANGTEMASTSINLANITSVDIKLQVDLNPTRAPDILTLEESATLRNLRQ